MNRPRLSVFVVVAAVAAGATALAPRGADFDLSWSTIDGGGVMRSTSGDLELSGTIGQPDAGGPMIGGTLELTGGFWFPIAAGDCNSDGGVNLFDYQHFVACGTGPLGGPVGSDCACFDLDGDDDVDLQDVDAFQRAFSGGS